LPGDVNPGPVFSRRGLLETRVLQTWLAGDPSPQGVACLRTVHIGRYELRVCHATGHDRAPMAWGHRNVPWTPSTGSEYVLVTYAALSMQR